LGTVAIEAHGAIKSSFLARPLLHRISSRRKQEKEARTNEDLLSAFMTDIAAERLK